MAQTEVYIASAARSPITAFQGSLATLDAHELGIQVSRAALERAGAQAEDVGDAVFGHVMPSQPRGLYSSRLIAVGTGAPHTATAMNVNRLCGSGAQAIVSATQNLQSGLADLSLAGGVEIMSAAPYSIDRLRPGAPMGDQKISDWLTGGLSCPFGNGHMGITAENVAAKYDISREQQDEFSAESHRRAVSAREKGEFDSQIVPITVRTRKGEQEFARDEHPRETSVEKLGALPTVFKSDGTVTAGNSSGINDGAATLVLATEEGLKKTNGKPLGRIVSWAVTGVDPKYMGIGPVTAVPAALSRAGLSLDDMDVIESNEAFAAQAIAVQKELGFNPEITNPQGGAVALGHPVGATGAILTTKALYYLHAHGGRYGLITLCIGGGQGIALIVEAL